MKKKGEKFDFSDEFSKDIDKFADKKAPKDYLITKVDVKKHLIEQKINAKNNKKQLRTRTRKYSFDSDESDCELPTCQKHVIA